MGREELRKLEEENLQELVTELGEKEGKQEFHRQQGILQDFYSKRAVAHASFFVASIFGLFTILALMERCSEKLSSISYVTALVLWFLSLTYWAVGALGIYSFLNFSRYTNLAHDALQLTAPNGLRLTAQKKDISAGKLSATDTRQERLLAGFNSVKSSGWFNRNNTLLLLSVYIAVALLAFVAFLLSIS